MPAQQQATVLEAAPPATGHGGGDHAGMSMDEMVRDMRNRFLVAALLVAVNALLFKRLRLPATPADGAPADGAPLPAASRAPEPVSR